MVAAGLIASRFLHFSAVLLLFGATAFSLYAYREDERSAQGDALFRDLRNTLLFAAIVALTSGILWLSFTSASMSGTLAGTIDPGIVLTVVGTTDFGRVWIWRLALAVVLVVLFLPKHRNEYLAFAQIAGSALLLTTIAGTGHAGADATTMGTVHVAADSLHLLAASAWIGGLVPLAIVLAGYKPAHTRARAEILRRFSGMGTFAVAALVASGLANAWFEVDGLVALATTPYGRWLTIKISLFLIMLGLAAANRFWLIPRLAVGSADSEPSLERIRMHVAVEQAIGFLVLGVVALLGTLEPAHLQAE
jgi:putative copper resistance protein D